MNNDEKIKTLYLGIIDQHKAIITSLKNLIERPGNTKLETEMIIPLNGDEVNLLYILVNKIKQNINDFKHYIALYPKDTWAAESVVVNYIADFINGLALENRIKEGPYDKV